MNDTITIPAVGDLVRPTFIPGVTIGTNKDANWALQNPVTVTHVETRAHVERPDGSWGESPVVYADFTDANGRTNRWYFTGWEPATSDTPPAPEPPADPYAASDADSPDVAALKTTIRELMAASERDNLALEQERTTKHRWERFAISVITRTDQEAVERDWCSVYDGIRDEFIEAAPYDPGFPEYGKREYEVTWTEYVSITVERSAIVEATNEDDAIEQARYMNTDEYDVLDAVRSGSWEVTDSDGFEAEEQ